MTAASDRNFVCPILIGRATQIEAVERRLRLALEGEPRTLLLSGEAGIGKSRLVVETVAAARTRGFRVLQGNCFEQDRALPYSAILELLRSSFSSRHHELQELLGPLSGEVAKIAPELLPGVAPAPVVDPEQEKRRVFYALSQLFIRLATSEPLLIVIEDLHWSDETTQQFVTYFARQIASTESCSVLVVLTYRNEEVGVVLEHVLAELDRERLATEIALTALTRAETDVMVRAIFGLQRSVRRDFLDALYEQTEGNPFFVEEVLRSIVSHSSELTETEGLDRYPLQGAIPRTVQDAVRHRAARLSDHAHRLLEIAAVAGQRFDLSLLQRLTNQSTPALLDGVKELMSAQLVVEESQEQFRFRHALTRDAIYSNLLGIERRELHRRITEETEERAASSPEGPDRYLADLAFHSYEAEDWEKALVYCQRAGERAQELFAPGVSVQHLTQAIEASRRRGGTISARLFRLRAAAYEILGQFDDALADHLAALAAARADDNRHEEWEIRLGLGMLWSARDYAKAREHYDAALELARTLDDQRLVARSLNRVGNYYVNIDETAEGVASHEEALRIFEGLTDRHGITETLDLLGVAWLVGGDLAQSRHYYERALQLFEEQGDRQGCVSALTVMGVLSSVYHTDTLPPAATFLEAEQWLLRAHRIAVEIGWRAGECFALWNLAVCLGPQGEYERALRYVREAIALAEEIEHSQWLSAALFVLGAIQSDLLDFASATASLERALAIAKGCGSMLWTRTAAGFLARSYLLLGDVALASRTLDDVLAHDAPAWTLGQRNVHSARVEVSIAQGHAAEALDCTRRLNTAIKTSERTAVPRLAKLEADVLFLSGDLTAAEQRYESAVSEARAQGLHGQLWGCYAALCALHEKTGARQKAQQARADAMRAIDYIAERIPEGGMRDSFRATSTARLPSLRPPSPRQAAKEEFGGLTEREREVAGLIGAGKSNAAIGEALVISERTVETHVTNILGKLGFASRSQIAAWAAERGMVRQTT
jgi:DNA-binding CsgD family transcriptional regulator/tetratricopeptide (TPR) repeat protein